MWLNVGSQMSCHLPVALPVYRLPLPPMPFFTVLQCTYAIAFIENWLGIDARCPGTRPQWSCRCGPVRVVHGCTGGRSQGIRDRCLGSRRRTYSQRCCHHHPQHHEEEAPQAIVMSCCLTKRTSEKPINLVYL